MASDEPPNPMAESGVTIRSDSEQYSRHEEQSVSPPSSSSPAVVLYKPPTIWSIIRGAAINLLLPFINGMMLGFGELFAHEAAFRLGWSNTRVRQSAILITQQSPDITANVLLGLPGLEATSTLYRSRNRSGGETKAEKRS